eukprot:5700642-Amphidinium_carterae.1
MVVLGALMQIRPDGVVMQNTPGRLEQIKLQCEELLRKHAWTRAEAAKLSGRLNLNFVRTLVAGRPLNPPLYLIGGRAASQDGQRELAEDEVEALKTVIAYTNVWVLYTHGSVENGIAGCGAVLCKKGLKAKVLQFKVPQELYDRWQKAGVRHAVAQAELFPVLVAKKTWFSLLTKADILHFTDNNEVKSALVRGVTRNLSNRGMLHAISELEVRLPRSV